MQPPNLMSSPPHQFPHNLEDHLHRTEPSNDFNVNNGQSYEEASNGDPNIQDNVNNQGSSSSNAVLFEQTEAFSCFISPNGSKIYYPHVADDIKPVIGTIFRSWDEVMYYYGRYAKVAGFSVRVGQTKKWKGIVSNKYLLCNRSGKPQTKREFDSTTENVIRQCTFTRSDCTAKISIKVCKETGRFVLSDFHEYHNHCLVDIFNQDLSKVSRKLTFSTKQFIHNMSLNRIGPVKAHRFMVSIMGGHHNVNGTPQDFKNYSQSVRMFIGDRDSQLLIDRLTERSKNLPDFYFDYTISKGKLKCIFWADEISKLNYKAFGDVLAFDATYQTNRYNLIFVPFTGVNNHKQCVTFGAGLIFSETTESYKWLLQQFLKAHGTEPSLVLTDQDPAMKAAIEIVLPEPRTRHRLCMWHIMKKLPSKVTPDLLQNTTLRASIHRLVWSVYIKTSTFETKWHELIEKFSLQENGWLKDMFAMRRDWIPAYFRDLPMCCLLKTTSCCESSNASFKVNSTGANTLVQFMLCFETVLENQRYRARAADFKSSNSGFESLTHAAIERHAFDIYTLSIFNEIQVQLGRGYYSSYISNTESDGDMFVYSVSHLDKRLAVKNTFRVTFDRRDYSASCTCMNFSRIGYLCRHIFHVYRVNQVDRIPSTYISTRWLKDALPKSSYALGNRYGVDNSVHSTAKSEILDLVSECVEVIRSDTDKLVSFANHIREFKSNLFEYPPTTEGSKSVNRSVVEELVGQPFEVEPVVSNPDAVTNKGRGKTRRMLHPAENKISKPPKAPRLCKTCNQYVTTHDSRNCHKFNKDSGTQDSTTQAD